MDASTAGIIVAIATPLVTAFGYWLKHRADSRASLPDQYKSLLDETRKHFEEIVDGLEKKVDDLSNEIAELKKAREIDKSKYNAALRHIRNWRSRHPDELVKMPIPPEIIDDL